VDPYASDTLGALPMLARIEALAGLACDKGQKVAVEACSARAEGDTLRRWLGPRRLMRLLST
jgi:hypothetical protein